MLVEQSKYEEMNKSEISVCCILHQIAVLPKIKTLGEIEKMEKPLNQSSIYFGIIR